MKLALEFDFDRLVQSLAMVLKVPPQDAAGFLHVPEFRRMLANDMLEIWEGSNEAEPGLSAVALMEALASRH